MFTVYVLRCETTGQRYTGQTDNLDARLAEHNGHSHNPRKHTSRHPGPWCLIHREEFATRSEAMRRERWLKSGAGRGWLDERSGRASPGAPGLTAKSLVRVLPGELRFWPRKLPVNQLMH